jgi:hypothetical protein
MNHAQNGTFRLSSRKHEAPLFKMPPKVNSSAQWEVISSPDTLGVEVLFKNIFKKMLCLMGVWFPIYVI